MLTPEGLRAIEDIKAGDYVLSRDEKTGEVTYKEVVRTFITPDQPVIAIDVEDENGETDTFTATGDHPFWVKARGWVGARELLPGDEIFTSAGGWLRVTGGTWLSERQTVYNFEVEDFHTYFVGESGAWVHNSCNPTKASKSGINTNRVVGNQFDDYVAGTKLNKLDEIGQLGRQERLPTPDIPGKNYVKPDYTIYDRSGNVAAYADAKSGAISFDAQAKGLIEWSTTTKSKSLIYYTPRPTSVPRSMIQYARDRGVSIIVKTVK